MLKRSRVSSTMDVQRLGQALARPGMDTRVWVSLARVVARAVDLDEGVFVDVELEPSGTRETARVAPVYAGNGFGLYAPLKVDDEVLVAIPNGDFDLGAVVLARLWNGDDKPPTDAREGSSGMESSDDLVLRVEQDHAVKVRVSGSGAASIIAEGDGGIDIETKGAGHVTIRGSGSGKVRLGGTSGLQPAVLGTTLQTLLNNMISTFNAHTHPAPGGATGVSTVPMVPSTVTAQEVEVV